MKKNKELNTKLNLLKRFPNQNMKKTGNFA